MSQAANDIRKNLRARRPRAVRHDAHKIKRIANVWRRPKGLHNKMRLGKLGYRAGIKIGYGSPVEIRGKTASGKEIVTISNVAEAKDVDVKAAAIVDRTLGDRKRSEVLKILIEKKIEIVNIHDASETIKLIEEDMKERAKLKKSKAEKKEEKKKSLEEVAKQEDKKSTAKADKASKESSEKTSTPALEKGADTKLKAASEDEDKAKAQKAEKDKVLTKPR